MLLSTAFCDNNLIFSFYDLTDFYFSFLTIKLNMEKWIYFFFSYTLTLLA